MKEESDKGQEDKEKEEELIDDLDDFGFGSSLL